MGMLQWQKNGVKYLSYFDEISIVHTSNVYFYFDTRALFAQFGQKKKFGIGRGMNYLQNLLMSLLVQDPTLPLNTHTISQTKI